MVGDGQLRCATAPPTDMAISLSGHFRCVTDFYLVLDQNGILQDKCTPETIHDSCLRADREFWLSLDEGQIGRHGSPVEAVANIAGVKFYVSVEPRGFSLAGRYQLGLVLCRNVITSASSRCELWE